MKDIKVKFREELSTATVLITIKTATFTVVCGRMMLNKAKDNSLVQKSMNFIKENSKII